MSPLKRYQRQTILPDIGIEGQKKLMKARILCIGAGGLGSPALLYLAAAGIGTLTIMDHDHVDESNLQRQIIYKNADIGAAKASSAAQHLMQQNPHTTITAITDQLTANNAANIFKDHDVIIDGTDNFASKFIINDAACTTNKPWVYGSILGFAGQVSSFNLQGSACYRCLFPTPPPQETLNCADAGVIGALAGIIGSMQAMEAIKIIINTPNLPALTNQLWTLNLQTMNNKIIALPKDPKCPSCSNNTQENTMTTPQQTPAPTQEITIQEAKKALAANNTIKLIDVREQHEWDAGHINGADHLPLSFLLEGHRPDLNKTDTIMLYCLRGMRSLQALQILKSQGYNNVSSIKGGYQAWTV